MLWSQAGNIINLDPYGTWEKPKSATQKIVFIGQSLNMNETKGYLDGVLVSV